MSAVSVLATENHPAKTISLNVSTRRLPAPFRTNGPAKAANARKLEETVVNAAVWTFSGIDEFKNHWEETKRRLGVEEAGETFEIFLRKNIKVIPLNPWAKPEESPIQMTGSFNPKTYDLLLTLVKLAPTTSEAEIFDPIMKISIAVTDFGVLVRAGKWTFGAIYPKPGKGLRLQSWETVSGLTARFTVPYPMDATTMKDADPMNTGTTEGIWTDETSDREVYELRR
ncbi:hypothetical protein OF83DRAFT_1218592 [Amylostereum chailletii]|nr:hypothetical protein OF83DRAFT_1218592 [Amylostereum chailletii]